MMRDQMTRLMRAALVAGLSGCLLLLATGSASAATTIGQNGAGGPGTCGAGNTFIQTGTGLGVPSYVVPAGGGVISSWSFLAGSTTGERDKLKVVRPDGTADQFVVVGESALEMMTPSSLNTFQVRIPVQAGDLIGLFTVDGNDCVVSTHTPGNTDLYVAGADPRRARRSPESPSPPAARRTTSAQSSSPMPIMMAGATTHRTNASARPGPCRAARRLISRSPKPRPRPPYHATAP